MDAVPPATPPPDPGSPREICARCRRPVSVCYCDALVSLPTRSRIVILQHPREEGMPIGTAHMAHLCLPQSSVHVGVDWDGSPALREACSDPERPPVLLYPGRGARDVLTEPPPAPVTLVVVDGTWAQARKLVRENTQLAGLPRYAFRAPSPSRYRIRKEPHVGYVSTLEALALVLGAIEGDPERFRALTEPLHRMVDAHLTRRALRPQPRSARRRPVRPLSARLPRLLLERWEDLVLVFADASAWPYDAPERRYGDELVHWVAHRPSTRETFDLVLAPRNPLAPDAPRHTELPREALLAGASEAELLDAFEAFRRPTDVLASWGHHGLRLFKDCGGDLRGPFLDVRQAARELTNTRIGTLEAFAARTLTEPAHEIARGRAGRRLGLLLGIVIAWRARAAAETG